MAEKNRLFEALVGEDGEESEELHSDPLAMAAGLDAARGDPALGRSLARYIALQSEHLHEQRELQLSRLRLKRLGDRIRAVTQICVMIVAAMIVSALLFMVWQASQSRAVIISPFDAPPGLAARGYTGKVIATGLLDALVRMHDETRKTRAGRRELGGAWGDQLSIEVPETGMSIADIDRVLRRNLGHDTAIDGTVTEFQSGNLALTVRADDVPPRSFAGEAGDLERLDTEAAEYIFSRAEPRLYSQYLSTHGRWRELAAFADQASANASGKDLGLFLGDRAVAGGELGETPSLVERRYREAIRVSPDQYNAYGGLSNTELMLGREEAAWRTMQRLAHAAGGDPGRASPVAFENERLLEWDLLRWRREIVETLPVGGSLDISSDAANLADIDTRLHDRVAADLDLAAAARDAGDPTVPALTHFVHGLQAEQDGDAKRAAGEMEAFGVSMKDPQVGNELPGYQCFSAPAEEMAGAGAEADAILAGKNYVDCMRFRGDTLDRRGDWAGAQRAYSDGVTLAPDLPAVYYSWGAALARHGDLRGAIEKLEAAHERGPGWADPLKVWGDVLVREGHPRRALAKYDAALKLAPEWPDLQKARADAVR